MEKLINETVKKELLDKFPEFKESNEFKVHLDQEGGPYEYFARFADFILKEIESSEDSEIVKRMFDFISNVYSRENLSEEVWDLFGIELLEVFEVNEKTKNLANKYLTGKALKAFQKQEGRPN